MLVEDADHHAAAQVGDVLLGEVWVDGVREVVGAECREDAAVVAILLAWRVRGGLDLLLEDDDDSTPPAATGPYSQ